MTETHGRHRRQAHILCRPGAGPARCRRRHRRCRPRPSGTAQRGNGALDHSRRKLRLGREGNVAGHVCGFQTSRIIGPALRQIKRPIDEGMAMARHVGGEHTDLAIGDLACRTRILPRHPARCLALLEEPGFINHQHRIIVREMLDDILAHHVAQRIGLPPVTPQKRLLPPRPRIASCLGAHPSRLAPLIAKQSVQEQACIHRRTLLREQWTHPALHVPQRRCPQLQRRLDRCSRHP